MTPSPDDSAPLRVLLVEDYPDLAVVMSEVLRNEGLEVQTALSGHEALDVALVFKPQLVLCDLNLPDMNGFDVARSLRSSFATRPVYIAVLSAIRDVELTRHEVEQQQVDAMISKPIGIEALRRLVDATRGRISQDRESPGR